jgi:hypothetical protein
MKRYGIPTIGTGTSMGGITTSSIKYKALGLESLRPAMSITGIATRANNQKLGQKNAIAVRAYQTLQRRERSFGAMNNSAIGFASLKMMAAITETQINSLRVTIIALTKKLLPSPDLGFADPRPFRPPLTRLH